MRIPRQTFGVLGLAGLIALGAGAIAAQHILTAAVIVGFAVLTTWVLARHS
ncbi:MAG: hypothetical protein K2Y35_19710 [Burkholderiales bacterium]|nr:hypothetical protein [Burkholderiales bacterium]